MKIFISYRRADTAKYAQKLYKRLEKHFSRYQLFMDIDDIPIGTDFRVVLNDVIHNSDIVLVLIGQEWLKVKDKDGNRRIDNPEDFVRIEVEAALNRRESLVIPVLFDNAPMPSQIELPDDIGHLAFQNAASIQSTRFDQDVDKLIKSIKKENKGTLSKFLGQLIKRDEQPKSVEQVLPKPFEWVHIPSGKTTVNYPPTFYDRYINRDLISVEELSSFRISKYPITRQQFDIFMKDENGYKNQRWWYYSKAALENRNKGRTSINTGDSSNLLEPARVNWYDAVAFCQWLNAKTDLILTLPSVTEWIRAAVGDKELSYPWGNDNNQDKFAPWGNSYSRRVEVDQAPYSSVNYYTNGSSQYGVMDMWGNVHEHTSTDVFSRTNDLTSTSPKWAVGGFSGSIPEGSINNLLIDNSNHNQSFGGTTEDIGFRIVLLSNKKDNFRSQSDNEWREEHNEVLKEIKPTRPARVQRMGS